MPIPILDRYTPELRSLITTVETGLHTLARHAELDREAAIDVKQRCQRPLGALNSRFQLTPNGNSRKTLTVIGIKS